MPSGVYVSQVRISYDGAVVPAWSSRLISISIENPKGQPGKMDLVTLILDNSDARFGAGGTDPITRDKKIRIELLADTPGSYSTEFWGTITSCPLAGTTISVKASGAAHLAAAGRPLECWYAIATDESVREFLLGTAPGAYPDTDGALYPEYDPELGLRLDVSNVDSLERMVEVFDFINHPDGETWWEMLKDFAEALDYWVWIDWNGTKYSLNMRSRLTDSAGVQYASTYALWNSYSSAVKKTHSIKRAQDHPSDPTEWGHDYLEGTGIEPDDHDRLDMCEVTGDPVFAVFGSYIRTGFTRETAKYREIKQDSTIQSDQMAYGVARARVMQYGSTIYSGTIRLMGNTDIQPRDVVRFYDERFFGTAPLYLLVAVVRHVIDDQGYFTELELDVGPSMASQYQAWLNAARKLDVFKDPQGATKTCLYATDDTVTITDDVFGVQYYNDFNAAGAGSGEITCVWTPCEDKPTTDLTDSDFYEYVIGYRKVSHPAIANDPDDYVAGGFGGKWGGANDATLFTIGQPSTTITGLDAGNDYYMALFIRCKAGESAANTYIRCAQIGPITAGA